MKRLKLERAPIEELKTDSPHFLSEQIKWMIIHYKTKGHSNKQTACLVGKEYNRPSLSHQTVKTIWNKYLKTNGVDHQWSELGRPSVLGETDLERLEEYFKKNPKDSIEEARIALQIDCSRPTINKALLERGFRAYRAPKKFYISPINISKRLDFANQFECMTLNYWKKVIFSDESSFALYNSNGRTLVRRLQDHKFHTKNVQMQGQSQTLMVWGIISFNGIGPLVRVDRIEEGEATLNGERYLTILKRYLLRNYTNLTLQKMIFQQDNAPAHRYHKVQSYLEDKKIKKINWPPQSPDMNLIESVWNELKFRLRGKVYRNKNKLWNDLQREWKLISKEYIRNLYYSLPQRIVKLKHAKGKHTKY